MTDHIPPYARGYESFAGRIGRTQADSTPAWPQPLAAAKDSPNVIVVLIDDLGFSDFGAFGSEIHTPTIDGLAREGLTFTNYHTTPVCSPARAALLTGLNPHRAGYGSVANSDPGFPGLRLELDEDVATLPEVLRARGYATFAVGKWHLVRDAMMNEGASKASWPIQRGFDHYYGSLEGLNSFFHPTQLVRDNTPVELGDLPDDYYLTDDYTQQALSMIKALRASGSTKPFFLYFAHTAMHGPIGAKPHDIDRYRGAYVGGWDELRERRHARQIELGIIPEGTPLPPRNHEPGHEVAAWESLTDEQRDLYPRYMEVYAAMLDAVDQSLARILATLDLLGERDNTLVVVTSDNGGTSEGGAEGTRSYFSRFVHLPDLPADWEPDVNRDPQLIGGPRTMVHYPRGWAMASNTPFRLYKAQTYAGGIRVPLVASWPQGAATGKITPGLRDQYQYVTDITPTILDLIGVEHAGQRHNLPTKSLDGVSFAPVAASPDAESTHREQYSEFGGNRGLYRDGWKIVTLHRPGDDYDDSQWELYHVATDPNELHNVADQHPELLAELAASWEKAAWENTVFPLPSPGPSVRRAAEGELSSPVTLLPGTPHLERYRSAALIGYRAYEIEVSFEVSAGDDGVLVSHGDQSGGYVLYVENGHLHYAYNEYGRLRELDAGPVQAGNHVVRVASTPIEGWRNDVEVTVDGQAAGRLEGLWLLVGMAPFSGIDVGVNRGGPVHWELHERRRTFPFSGNLHYVRYTPGTPAPYSPEQIAQVENAAQAALD